MASQGALDPARKPGTGPEGFLPLQPPLTYASLLFGHSEVVLSPERSEALLDLLRAHPEAYVSFHYEDAPDPDAGSYSNEVTPRALYGFPRDFAANIAHWWSFRREVYPVGGIDYLHRPWVSMFNIEGVLLSTVDYSSRRLLADLEALAATPLAVSQSWEGADLATGWDAAASALMSWHRGATRHVRDDAHHQVRYLLLATEAAVDAVLPVCEVDNSGFKGHPSKPTLWRAMLSSLGYAAVVDRHAVLTGDMAQQVAVLRPDAIRDLVSHPNPAARPLEQDAPRPR